MKQKHNIKIVLVASAISCLLVARPPAPVSASVVVRATVAPLRTVVVDHQGRILQITSNTRSEVTPRVYLDKVSGKQLPFTSALKAKYDKISQRIDFSKLGIVYIRHSKR